MWNKQCLTTMLILLQQASLLRGLGSLNQRSEWLWLPHHFSVYTTLAALNIFWLSRTAWAVLMLSPCLQVLRPSASCSSCSAGDSGTMVGCAALEKKARDWRVPRLIPIIPWDFSNKGILPWLWGITQLPSWRTESLWCVASNPPLLVVQHSLILAAVPHKIPILILSLSQGRQQHSRGAE